VVSQVGSALRKIAAPSPGAAPTQAASNASNGVASGDAAAAESYSHPAKRQRIEHSVEGGLADGEVTRVTAQGPAACYVCRLADVPGKFQPDKVCKDES